MERLLAGAERLGLRLSAEQQFAIRRYGNALLERNQKVNLTGAADWEELEVRHLLDSLTVAPHLPDEGGTVIDVGSGGGLPGIPLAIVRPDLSFTLLDSVGKKTKFLEEMAATLPLPNVTVVTNRAELAGQMWEYRQRYHLAVARALADLPVLIELTLPFVRLLGTAVLMKKGNLTAERERSRRALRQLGGTVLDVESVPLQDLLPEHKLVIVEKVRPSQAQFPRRPGTPERRPLV